MIGLPLVGAFFNGLVLKTKHPRRAGVIATGFAAASFVCAILLFLSLEHTGSAIQFTREWFTIGSTKVEWGFRFDHLTAVMALIITGIGTLIHLYSIGYMSEEPTPYRYFAYLNLFLFAMLTLISGDNLAVMFVGWEGVGLCSYLLIGYWYQDPEKANAGMKAFVVNRIGDAGFLIGIFCCFQIFGGVNFEAIRAALPSLVNDPHAILWLNIIAIFLFVGAAGKSAQIPLYVWLPDAMAGPTPVSALIHAATMVTAGIYLIVRMNGLFALTADTNFIIACVGGATALMSATIAVAQRDIKKVLAYSTVSQLGLMFLALGTGNYFAAFFHVLTHAFFKALMFLGAGSVIHALSGEQDICKMGGLKKYLPYTHWTFFIGWLAICGLPPLSGFFSKDMILFGALMSPRAPLLLWSVGMATSVLTAFYMTRLYALTFLGEYRGHEHPHESPAVMTIPLIVLAVGSAFAGFLGMPHAFHMLPNYLGHFLSPVVPEMVEIHTPISEWMAMGLATGSAIVAVSLGLFFYAKGPARSESAAKAFGPLQKLLANKYWVDEIYDFIVVRPFRIISAFLARFFDPRIVDGAVLFPARLSRAGATVLSMVQTGAAQFYLLIMLLGALGVLWYSLKGAVI